MFPTIAGNNYTPGVPLLFLNDGKGSVVPGSWVKRSHANFDGEMIEHRFADRTNWDLAPNGLSEALAQHRAAGKPLFDLTVSNPTECEFEYDSEAILKGLGNPAALKYEPNPRGLEVARNAVARYYAEHHASVSAEDLVLTTSTSEAYSFVFRTLCNPGDEILIPQPSYPLLRFLADIQDVKLVSYPLIYDHGWQIDFHTLEKALSDRTRGIIVVHPNNPTGNFCRPGEIAQLNEICAARGLAVIADEVFLDFALTGEPRDSFAANSGALTFMMSGLSKVSGLPQMKAAWLAVSGPEPLKREALGRIEVIADTYLSVNAPVQLAIPEFLELRHVFQKQLMARVRANLAELDRQLAGQQSCASLKVEGGWYAVLRVPAVRPDEDLARDLLQSRNVYVHPGHFYDFPGDGYLVVSLITPQATFFKGMLSVLAMF